MDRRQFLKSLAGLAGVAAGAKIAPVLPEVAKAVEVSVPPVIPMQELSVGIWNGLEWVSWPSSFQRADDGTYFVGGQFLNMHHRAATLKEWEQYWYTGKLESAHFDRERRI